MFGISGTALGAILRSRKYSYTQLSAVAGVYALIVLVLSVFVLLFASWGLNNITISDLSTWIPDTMDFEVSANPLLMFLGAFAVGISAFLSMFIGSLVFDASEAIVKGIR